MIAGPNGSGKSTLAQQLTDDYAINLYKFLNADMLFAEIAKSYKTACPFNINNQDLLEFINTSTYPDDCKTPFRNHLITIDEEDYFVFDPCAINSYTVAMVADFLKDQYHYCGGYNIDSSFIDYIHFDLKPFGSQSNR